MPVSSPASPQLAHASPAPCRGSYADGFAPVAEAFAGHFARSGDRELREIGAALTVYHRGVCVVDLRGGVTDVATAAPWQTDTRLVVYSVTKGLAAMGLALLADRGLLEWDAPVATYWPGFAQAGKAAITCRVLANHQAGLCALDEPLTLADCVDPARYGWLVSALERQKPLWEPGSDQGYHAITFGFYVRELFERIAGESLGTFLERELFGPLGADVSLGTPASVDARIATVYPPSKGQRVVKMLASAIVGGNAEARVLRSTLARDSLVRRAFFNPKEAEPHLWNEAPIRRSELASGSATASAHGLARAYLPFAFGGSVDGRAYLKPASLAPLYERQGWSERDRVLQKPIGWSQGFVKEETSLFSPERAAFGHPGIGGALGFCDPKNQLTIGYVPSRLDWRVRSPRALALCRALYECAPVRDTR
jgi:CubicO group peptidase (beta-lactamase class C family)